MSDDLQSHIIKHIRAHGPMNVAEYMTLALGHPKYGYYMKKDPFGAAGDFTTAPEVSQLFGEMIGAWLADVWLQMDSPNPCVLLECGPGRGTLMADIMRATKNVTGFHEAVQIHLLEMSPVLKDIQAETLQDHKVHFHETMQSVVNSTKNTPKLIIANEFFDALPIRQFRKNDGNWEERVISLEGKNQTNWSYRNVDSAINEFLKKNHQFIESHKILELSSARENMMYHFNEVLRGGGGAALIIDYGHERTVAGDTLQAVYKHEYCDVLDYIGDADLSAHVDFESLKTTCHEAVQVFGPVEQGKFLKALGIDLRAGMLGRDASEDQKKDIEQGLHRLCAPDQMGKLFKVMGISYGYSIKPAGF